jgi:galactokinase
VEALRAGDLNRVGSLLVESHESMRDDFEISTAELDTQVEVALEEGALGARMTGGGFGGSVIALVATSKVDSLTAVSKARALDRDMPETTISVVVPSEGATRHTSA